MSQPVSQPAPKIFISYRRDDSAGHAGRLFDRLSSHFNRERLFMDVDHIEPGEDFVQVIEDAVASSAVLLVIIGRRWLTSGDTIARRLDNPNDFVRLEVASALARNIRVIPVLVQNAIMPSPQDLPDDLLQLSRRNASELSDLRWNRDVDQLIGVLDKFLAKIEEKCRKEQETEEERRREAEAQHEKEESSRRAAKLAPALTKGISSIDNSEVSSVGVAVSARDIAPPRTMMNRLNMEFVWIPPGSFVMGSENKYLNEQPSHRVTINSGFYLGKYQVTQAQWQKVMGNNPSHFKGDDLPVESVSYNDAYTFIAKLNAQHDGYTYRLPTEAEWEYAARAGTTGHYAGDLDGMAWYGSNSGKRTHPVGGKQPNAFGLYDMHGNVWEWIEDWYQGSYADAPTDGSARLRVEEQTYRVLRGGSWENYPETCRSGSRGKNVPEFRGSLVGFRLVAVPT